MSAPLERDYQATIVAAAQLGGWLVHAERPARTREGWRTAIEGTPGFPDLVLVHPGGRPAMFIELKRRPNRPTTAQRLWGTALLRAGLDYRLIFVPDDMPALIAELTDRPVVF